MRDVTELRDCKILVVEDEALVAMLIQDMLEEIGCRVMGVASRLSQAVEQAKSLAIDAAVIDVNLNGQTTSPIAEELVRRGVPFLFATGYGADSLPAPFRRMPILGKPFQQNELAEALHALVNGKR